jgi:hypothetical protein
MDEIELTPEDWNGFPRARFLSEAEQVRYADAISQYTGTSKIVLDGHSNLFKVLKLNEMGIRTATLPELDLALRKGLPFSGIYADSREVILRSAGDSERRNDALARQLAKEVGYKDGRDPIILKGLELVEADNSYGLSFDTSNAEDPISAPDFAHKNNSRKFTRINPDYTIEWAKEGDKNSRILYTREHGLSRLCVYDRGVDANYRYLDYSFGDGRVVVVGGGDAEGVAKLYEEIKAEKERRVSVIANLVLELETLKSPQ